MTTPIARRCVRRAGNNGITTNAWLVGGNSNLPTTDGDTYVLGITGDTSAGSDMAIVTGDDPRIHINGDAPSGASFGAQSGGRVYVNNGAVETLSVPMTVQRVMAGTEAVSYVDLYMNLPSNAYTVGLDTTDASADGVVSINNIFGAQLVPPAPDRGAVGYPTTIGGAYSAIDAADILTFREFTYTLRIINNADAVLDVDFTPNGTSTKLTPTDVSYTLASYNIPVDGYMIATFRVVRALDADGVPTSEHHMMIAHTVYDASGVSS